VSDRTRQLRDEEQQHLADQAMRSALRIIRSRRDKLDALAFALLRNEVLERPEIDRIMADVEQPEQGAAAGDLRVVAAAER
jgi:cell division protease FtsH